MIKLKRYKKKDLENFINLKHKNISKNSVFTITIKTLNKIYKKS
jgi:DNA-binding Xre family transcriptional regulator